MLSLRGCRARTAVLLAAWFGLSLAASTDGAEPIRGELLVKTRGVPGAGPQLMGGLRLPAGARVERVVGTRGWRLVRLAADQPLEEALRWFRGQEGVLAVEPNHRYQLHTAAESTAARLPDDPQLTRLFGLANIGAPEVWGRTVGSTNVVVAILDTGVDILHPDLAANIWRNRREIPGNGRDDDANGWIDDHRGVDVVEGDGDPNDEAGHGTHVAGTIGAVGNNALGVSGVCWNVSLLPVRVGKADGFGTTDQLVAAFDYVVALRERGENVRVINCSWGGGFPSFALNEAVAAAGAAGVLVVCSAGNDRQDNDLLPVYPACFDVPQILSVASSTSCDEASSFSNFGRTTVDLAAPGSGILSTFRGGARYAVLSGTSMASPHVAGAAALLLAHRPNLTVDALRTLILSSVDVLPAWAGRVVSGGRLNLARALAAADTVPAPATPAAPAARLESISRHPTRSWGNDTSSGGVVSADGRWVAFDSFATNLVTGDREGYRDVFLVDRLEHTLVRISQTTAGVGGRGDSYNPAISADGRVVVFVSEAQDLTVGDANGAPDIYVWDRETRRLELVSLRQDGRGAGNAESDSPALSADGTQVAFASAASDLVASDSNKTRDVFVRNRTMRLTERVSVSSGGVQGNAYSDAPSMSADGSVVAFHSYASNLVTRDRNATWDVFVRDRRLGTTERVSAPEGGILESDDRSEYPILSADGRYVVFMSYADLLDGGEPDEFLAVMVVDRQTRSVRRVDRRPGVTTSAGDGYPESISADGRLVFFSSDDVQLAPGGAPGLFRVFVHDQSTGATGPLDVSEGGYGPEDNSFQARCSPDGRYVAFTSFAYNLVPGDGNSTADVFLLDRGETRTDLSVRRSGGEAEPWVGEGFLHAMVPQRASTLVDAGGVAAFEVKVCNAGPEAAFLLRGEGPVTGGAAGVKVIWGRTGADLTDAVLGAGWQTGVMPAGAYEVLRVEMIQPTATSLEPRRDFRLGASPISGGAASDAVELVVAAPETAPALALASRAGNGSPASRNAEVAGLSRDGRFVVFSSDSEAMETRPDTNFMADVFLWDRREDRVRRVSDASPTQQANADCRYPSISDDGTRIAFQARASNLVPFDSNDVEDVFVRDLASGVIARISVSSAGAQANRGSDSVTLAGGGRFAAFTSFATNLVAGDANGSQDIFVRDLESGTTECVSRSLAGVFGDADSDVPAISGDGRFVVFQSMAGNLGPADANRMLDVYLWDRTARTMELISVGTNGVAGNGPSGGASLSDDGRWITFYSYASDLAAGASFTESAAYLYDRQSRSLQRVDSLVPGLPAGLEARRAGVSRDGSRLSLAVSPRCGAGSGPSQVYVFDRLRQRLDPVSVTVAGGWGADHSFAGRWSAEGRFLSIETHAANLIGEWARPASQVMVADLARPAVDALVQREPGSPWRGASILGEGAQTILVPMGLGPTGDRVVGVILKNLGTAPDRFRVQGRSDDPARLLVVAGASSPGGTDPLPSLVLAGWETPVLEPGAELSLGLTLRREASDAGEAGLSLRVVSLTNPQRVDALRVVSVLDLNGDRIPDSWFETHLGPSTTSDDDGLSVYDEWLTGSDPTDPDSVSQRLTVMGSPTGGVEIGWTGAAYRYYWVERSAPPGIGFVPVSGAPLAGTSGRMTWRDDSAAPPEGAMYRLRIELP